MWMFEIFKLSMNARIQALGLIGLIFVTFSIIYYEIVIQTVNSKRPVLHELATLHHHLIQDSDIELILQEIERADELYYSIEKEAETLYAAFNLIFYLCIFNMTFLIQHILTFIFAKKLNRFQEFP